MIRAIGRTVAVSLVVLAPLTLAHAQTAAGHAAYACPAVEDIVAKPGVTYGAPAANGKQWAGADPMAADDIRIDPNNTRFKGGYVNPAKNSVICEYEHAPAGTAGHAAGAATQIRLRLELKKNVDTTGDQWKTAGKPGGPVSQHCPSRNPAQCTFN